MAKPKKVKRSVRERAQTGASVLAPDLALCSCGEAPKEYAITRVAAAKIDYSDWQTYSMEGELCYGCACAWDDLGWVTKARRL